MQKGIVKAGVLGTIFIVAVIIFSIMTNQTNEDLTTEMAEATLPVITLYSDNVAINELHGYSAEMDAAYMRDTITPIGENRILPIQIQTYQKPVDTISYEIRSLDAKRLIANADVNSYAETGGTISLELAIQNLLEAGEEYLMVITLESGNDTIHYYTRIMEPVDAHVMECLDFVKKFNDTTFGMGNLDDLKMYLERPTGNNDTLHYTTLNNSLKQIGWDEFSAERLTAPIPSIKEITSTYSVIVLDYVVTHIGDNGEIEYYNVEEYYRVRYTAQRMYVLNFERTVEQIFNGENAGIAENYIQLGIRSEEMEYKTNETGSVIAFVQEGELWCYNQMENTLAKVFGFRGFEGIDARENYGEHDIKVVGVDEAGSVDYIVYGYMNRGIHEGEVGIAIYHYDSLANTNEEAVFIPSTQSYEVMKSELGQLMYVTEGGMFYIMMDGSVYGIDLNTLEVKTLVSGLVDEELAVSASNRFFAWIEDEDGIGSRTIHMMDFTTEKSWEIKERQDEYLKPLGFMEEDFVYGITKSSDVLKDAAGNITFPMYQVKIVDTVSEKHDVLKTYEKEGYYVADIDIEGFTIYLNRIQFNGTAYVDANQDMIMNREGDSSQVVSIQTTNRTKKETEVRIALPQKVSGKAPKLLTPKETLLESEREVVFEKNADKERYYVYVKGDVILTTDSVVEAIVAANDGMGVVIGDDQQYVWKRARRNVQSAFNDISVGEEDKGMGSIAQCINAMLQKEDINISVNILLSQGKTPKEILGNTMRDVTVLDLTGCTTDEVLYYVSNGAPVFAMTDANEAVLIIGYDAKTITVFDPKRGDSYRKSQEEANELFENAGSIFFTYLK